MVSGLWLFSMVLRLVWFICLCIVFCVDCFSIWLVEIELNRYFCGLVMWYCMLIEMLMMFLLWVSIGIWLLKVLIWVVLILVIDLIGYGSLKFGLGFRICENWLKCSIMLCCCLLISWKLENSSSSIIVIVI